MIYIPLSTFFQRCVALHISGSLFQYPLFWYYQGQTCDAAVTCNMVRLLYTTVYIYIRYTQYVCYLLSIKQYNIHTNTRYLQDTMKTLQAFGPSVPEEHYFTAHTSVAAYLHKQYYIGQIIRISCQFLLALRVRTKACLCYFSLFRSEFLPTFFCSYAQTGF